MLEAILVYFFPRVDVSTEPRDVRQWQILSGKTNIALIAVPCKKQNGGLD
jgi:hypothetical protein